MVYIAVLLLHVLQILQVTTLLVSDETQNILFYIFLLHPTYGWVDFAEHRHSFNEFQTFYMYTNILFVTVITV